MILSCLLCQVVPISDNSLWKTILPIILGGLGGVIVAALVTISYDLYKSFQRKKNLYKGFISEMEVNKEYLKHNYSLAESIQNKQDKPSIFIPVRNNVCVTILTSGEIKLDINTRKLFNHYLVTLDHLNQMIKTIERTTNFDKEYDIAIERIKRYCRQEPGKYSENFDFIYKHIDKMKDTLLTGRCAFSFRCKCRM